MATQFLYKQFFRYSNAASTIAGKTAISNHYVKVAFQQLTAAFYNIVNSFNCE